MCLSVFPGSWWCDKFIQAGYVVHLCCGLACPASITRWRQLFFFSDGRSKFIGGAGLGSTVRHFKKAYWLNTPILKKKKKKRGSTFLMKNKMYGSLAYREIQINNMKKGFSYLNKIFNLGFYIICYRKCSTSPFWEV